MGGHAKTPAVAGSDLFGTTGCWNTFGVKCGRTVEEAAEYLGDQLLITPGVDLLRARLGQATRFPVRANQIWDFSWTWKWQTPPKPADERSYPA